MLEFRKLYSILVLNTLSGADPEISERGAGSQILERGGWNSTFQCGVQSFSYKSLTNIPAKGGAAACPAPPLNLRLFMMDIHSIEFLLLWCRRHRWVQKRVVGK